MTQPTVKVRIAVAATHDQAYAMAVEGFLTDETALEYVTKVVGVQAYIVTATLPIPTATEVEGRVEP